MRKHILVGGLISLLTLVAFAETANAQFFGGGRRGSFVGVQTPNFSFRYGTNYFPYRSPWVNSPWIGNYYRYPAFSRPYYYSVPYGGYPYYPGPVYYPTGTYYYPHY